MSCLVGSLHCCACTDSAAALTQCCHCWLFHPYHQWSRSLQSLTICNTCTRPMLNFQLCMSRFPLSTFASESHFSIWCVSSFSAYSPSHQFFHTLHDPAHLQRLSPGESKHCCPCMFLGLRFRKAALDLNIIRKGLHTHQGQLQ